jgi:phage gpG-like protein
VTDTGSGPIRVEGARDLARTMRRAGVDIAELKRAHERVGKIVVTRAKSLAPKQTGRLAGSIRPAKQASAVVVRAGGGSVPYAGVQQWGWAGHSIAATYFLTNGVDQSREQVLDTYTAEINRFLLTVKGA